jgi:polyribonucleotide nucleotidyltransferase
LGRHRGRVSSWNGKRAIEYRRIEKIPDEWGTAVNATAISSGRMTPENLERYRQEIGDPMKVRVIEVDRARRRLILSERLALQETRETLKDRLLDELAEGDVRSGRVTSLADFGAFVNIDGADGLVLVSVNRIVKLAATDFQRLHFNRFSLRRIKLCDAHIYDFAFLLSRRVFLKCPRRHTGDLRFHHKQGRSGRTSPVNDTFTD